MRILTLNKESLLIAIWSLKNNAYGATIMEKILGTSWKKTV
jgi:hypothetical protein